MAINFTAQDLQTLRLLSRTALIFSAPSSSNSFSIRFARGGESITPITRRQIRKAIQSIPQQKNFPFTCEVVTRYGAPERRSRIFRSPSLNPLTTRLKGQIVFIDIIVNFNKTPSSLHFQDFFDALNSLFKQKTFSLNQSKEDKGPSLRIISLTRPFLTPSLSEKSEYVFRPLSDSSAFSLKNVETSLVGSLVIGIKRPVLTFTALPQNLATKRTTQITTPYLGLLGLLNYQIFQLSTKKLIRWYNGCAQRLQIFAIAVRFRFESLVGA